ncbi:MAG: TlpA disulfide reductase family protein [Pyrinomonadaceae bacterium]
MKFVFGKFLFCSLCLATVFVVAAFSQAPAPTPSASLPIVTKVDEKTVMPLLKPSGKPLLINFWATWCVPCVEEFPLLVSLHKDYKDKIDIITISLDDPIEATRDVPKFLAEQNAEMPAYLLYTKDENAVISSVTDKWAGGLPFTLFLDKDGKKLYERQGLLKEEVMKPLIDSSLEIKECVPEETDKIGN